MNFGERLAYWYLRLNGFLLIEDFVYHRVDEIRENAADCDLLAVRFPYVEERIGATACAWDRDFFRPLDPHNERPLVALIVEVKTGQFNGDDLDRSFGQDRLQSAIERLGIWPSEEVGEITTNLSATDFIRRGPGSIALAKLLIADRGERFETGGRSLYLSMRQADRFICNRIQEHIDDKHADRVFFPSDLFQYVIWKAENGDQWPRL